MQPRRAGADAVDAAQPVPRRPVVLRLGGRERERVRGGRSRRRAVSPLQRRRPLRRRRAHRPRLRRPLRRPQHSRGRGRRRPGEADPVAAGGAPAGGHVRVRALRRHAARLDVGRPGPARGRRRRAVGEQRLGCGHLALQWRADALAGFRAGEENARKSHLASIMCPRRPSRHLPLTKRC